MQSNMVWAAYQNKTKSAEKMANLICKSTQVYFLVLKKENRLNFYNTLTFLYNNEIL